jgi:hypothetical protein
MRQPSAAPPPAEPTLPAPDCDLLRSTDQIGKWLGWTRGQVRAAIDRDELPTFRLRTGLYAFKSEIIETFRQISRRPGATEKLPRKPKAT